MPVYFERIEKDDFSRDTISVSRWIINHFYNYCIKHEIKYIDMGVISNFYFKQYDIDINNITCPCQGVIRKPMLTIMELYENDTYYRHHLMKVESNKLNDYWMNIYVFIRDKYIETPELKPTTKHSKCVLLKSLLYYFQSCNIASTHSLSSQDVINYIDKESVSKAKSTIVTLKSQIRLILNALYDENMIKFSGRSLFPELKNYKRYNILSTYSDEEVKSIIDSIDTETKAGKLEFAALSLVVYLGLRSSDIINLKFSDIDFTNNIIHITQFKTGRLLTLPLIDEVKFPLLDYMKNGRMPTDEKEYIFVTIRAPHRKFCNRTGIYRIVEKTITGSGVIPKGRKKGPHALRHSLATSMINHNVQISAIGDVLGHTSSKTTEVYISRDSTHLRKLTLEVPYAL